MRPIDADALVNNINERIENMTGVGVAIDGAYLWALIFDEINEAPTIEPSGETISREDAIEALRGLFDMRKSRAKVIVECFGELLNALPSAEPSGDLISRAEAIRAVMAEGRNVHASEYANAERIIHEADAVEALAMLPSADRQTDESCQDCPIYSAEEKNCPRFNKVIPQTRAEMNRPKGEWVEDFNFVHRAWRCSKCFAVTSTKTPFCHECGADMRGVDR